MRTSSIVHCLSCLILMLIFCGSAGAATKTSAATGLFSVGATWVGGVAPVDTDAFVIANTHVVTFDMDQSAWAGMATSTINAGGTLIASTTAGAYVLKMAGNLTVNGTLQAGTSEAVPYPATCTFTINFSAGARYFSIGSTGKMYFYCNEPAIKYIKTTGALTGGVDTVIPVDTDVTGDIWAVGNEIGITDVATSGASDIEIRTIAAGGIAANQITVTAAVTNNKVTGAYVGLVTRNIRVVNSTYTSPVFAFNAAATGSYVGCEIQTPRAFSGGVGNTYASAAYTSSVCITSGTSHELNSIMWAGGVSTSLYGIINCSINGLIQGYIGSNACKGCSFESNSVIAGCVTGASQNVDCVYLGTIRKCNTGMSSDTSPIIYGSIKDCPIGIDSGSGVTLSNATLNNTIDLSAVGSGKAYNTLFSGGTEFASYSSLQRLQSSYFESFDHDQVVNAFKAWSIGGIITSQTASPPSGYTIFYDHEVESAIYPCFRQYQTTVLPGTAIEVSAVIRNTDGIDVSATSPIDLRPRLEIIDVFADPLVDSTQTALDSDPIAVSNGTNTDWQAVDVIWANTGDSPRQVYVRIICYSHDASTHTIDEAWSVADYQDQIAAIYNKLPTNYIMGSSVVTDKDDEIDAILTDTSAYDTDAEYAAAIWNAAITSYGTVGSYGEELEDLDPNITLIKAITDVMQAVNSTVSVIGDSNTFTIANTGDINDVNDAYEGMTVYVRDATTGDWEDRLIENWETGRVITVDVDFTFTPEVGDIVIIWGTSYFPIDVYNGLPLPSKPEVITVDTRASTAGGGTRTLDAVGDDP